MVQYGDEIWYDNTQTLSDP